MVLTACVNEELAAAIRRFAEAEDRTVSNYLEIRIRRHVAEKGIDVSKKPRGEKSDGFCMSQINKSVPFLQDRSPYLLEEGTFLAARPHDHQHRQETPADRLPSASAGRRAQGRLEVVSWRNPPAPRPPARARSPAGGR
jgi:hypothetical protein